MDLAGFLLAIFPIALSPGASFTLGMTNAVNQGARGLLTVIIGTALGIYTHAFLAGLGITTLVTHYGVWLTGIKLFGTLYLTYLAIKLINAGLRRAPAAGQTGAKAIGIKEAYVANVLNAKAILLYLAVAPQFLPAAQMTLWNFGILASIHIAIMAVWLVVAGYLLIVAAAKVNFALLTKIINIGGGGLLLYFTLAPYLHVLF